MITLRDFHWDAAARLIMHSREVIQHMILTIAQKTP